MSFAKDRLPDPVSYYEAQGLKFRERKGKWRTAGCPFHGSTDSLRVNAETGAFVCMAGCGARGGDVLAYEMAITGSDFPTAAKALGAWIEDGKPEPRRRPTPFPARDCLEVLRGEAVVVAISAANMAYGVTLNDNDRQRLLQAASRVQSIAEVCT